MNQPEHINQPPTPSPSERVGVRLTPQQIKRQYAEKKHNLFNTVRSLGHDLFKNRKLTREEFNSRLLKWEQNQKWLNEWLLDRGTVKKKIETMTTAELQATVTQLREVISHINQSIYRA